MKRSVLAPLFSRLLMLQQHITQAVQAEQWNALADLDAQLRLCLQELAPHKPSLNAQQQQLLAQFAEQYRQQWQQVCQNGSELERQLMDFRLQREGNLAYDWVAQLGDES